MGKHAYQTGKMSCEEGPRGPALTDTKARADFGNGTTLGTSSD